MQKYFRIPFLFLIVAALIGLMLRFTIVSPIGGLVYSNWLHTHSHLMFLGWLFNFFNLAFVYYFLQHKWESGYRRLFIINQCLLAGMLIFFPLQGYGVITIILSTLHTIVSAVFCFFFISDTSESKRIARWFAKWSLIFFLVSSLGPFSLGFIMVNHLNQTKWYFFAVYFYLHFQYNGFFSFAVLALLLKQLERKGLHLNEQIFRKGGVWLIISCFVSYILSILWANPGIAFNIIGFVAAAVQFLVFLYLGKNLLKGQKLKAVFLPGALMFLKLVLFSFVLKFFLQMLSAHPYFVKMTYENRYLVIAYLHLVLIGGITFFVVAWYLEEKFIKNINRIFVMFLVLGFTASEIVLVLFSSLNGLTSIGSLLIFIFSLIMFGGIVGMFMNLLRAH